MFITILAIISNIFALNYHKGDTFSYTYNSVVNMKAGFEDSESTIHVNVDLTATFNVLSVAPDGVYMQLKLSDLQLTVDGEDGSKTVDDQTSIEEIVSQPLFFKLRKNGSIVDVIASKKDSEEIVNLKTSVAYALRTNLEADSEDGFKTATVIDPMGKHTEYTVESQRGNARTIETYFSESDFVQFSDGKRPEETVGIESQSTHILGEDRITGVTSNVTVVLNKKSKIDASEEEELPIVISGTSSLTDYTELDSNTVSNVDLQNVPKFLVEHREFGRVSHLRDTFYSEPTFISLDRRQKGSFTRSLENGGSDCPSAVTLCQSISASKTLGNNNIGMTAAVKGVVGIEKGCKSASRSYIVGAYATIDLKIIGKSINALDAYAEYGQVDGSALRNSVSVSIFGQNLYQKNLPYLDCKEKSQTVFNKSKDRQLSLSVPVLGITLSMTATISFAVKAEVAYQICPNQLTAHVTFTPSATASIEGSAKASIIVASATLMLTGSIDDYLDPKAYVDGNLCRIGFVAVNHNNGMSAKLSYKYRVAFWKSKEHKIWSASWAASTQTLIDKYWS